jgi:hypothetical protein
MIFVVWALHNSILNENNCNFIIAQAKLNLSLCSYLALHEDISFSRCIVPCNVSLTLDGEYSALSSATLSLGEEPLYSLDSRCGGPPKLVWTLWKKKSLYGNQTSIPPVVQLTILAVFWLTKDHLSSFYWGKITVILTTILDDGKYCRNHTNISEDKARSNEFSWYD